MTEAPKAEARSLRTANILAIAGFILIGVVVIWGLIHLAFLSAPWVSSLFGGSGNGNEITVSTPASVASGQPAAVHWNYNAPSTGTYALLFTCATNLRIAVLAPNNALQPVPCGAAFTIAPAQAGTASSTIQIVPFLAASTSEQTTISILFIPNTASSTGPSASGNSAMTITPGSSTANTGGASGNGGSTIIPVPVGGSNTTSSGTHTTTSSGTSGSETNTSKPSGTGSARASGGSTPKPVVHTPADLRVTILSITADQYGNGTAIFDIANDGGMSSGTYYFTAALPTAQPYTYSSPAQTSLAPGSHVVSTLNFTEAVTGTFSVVVDPSNVVRESNKSNNTASQTLSVPISYNSYQAYNTNPNGSSDYTAYENYSNSYNQYPPLY